MAAGFLALAPLLFAALPLGLFLIYLHTPVYMIHQVEEHHGDRFRRFVNDRLFHGADVLRVVDVLVINLPIVWGLNLGALYAALAWGPGFGLVAPYAMLVNAAAYVATSVRFRQYNPGLLTSLLLFAPLAVLTLRAMPSATAAQHILGLGLAVLLHALIVANAARRVAALRAKR